MDIISHRQFVTETHYELFFQWADTIGDSLSGMGFECDQNGLVNIAKLEKKPAALENYRKCLSGEHAVKAPQIQKFTHSYSEPAIGKCQCGCEVVLDSFTCTCDGCGRDYNSSGQLLAPRSQWGEETGECAADLVNLFQALD